MPRNSVVQFIVEGKENIWKFLFNGIPECGSSGSAHLKAEINRCASNNKHVHVYTWSSSCVKKKQKLSTFLWNSELLRWYSRANFSSRHVMINFQAILICSEAADVISSLPLVRIVSCRARGGRNQNSEQQGILMWHLFSYLEQPIPNSQSPKRQHVLKK